MTPCGKARYNLSMKRAPSKKGNERRRESRGKAREATREDERPLTRREAAGVCQNCSGDLTSSSNALFVEEEVGRVFCSEECIIQFFAPEIERLEREYYRKLSASDLSAPQRESLTHLRWITLQEPDEIWREKTLSGDYRYTLISEFRPSGNKKVWSICICLFLRGEPSFLFLAFPTRNAAMVNTYRKGERVTLVQKRPKRQSSASEEESDAASASPPATVGTLPLPEGDGLPSDRLAESWTEEETYLAQLGRKRKRDDIQANDFGLYEGCLEETLEEPDEVWSARTEGKSRRRLFHFIRHYPQSSPSHWYVIVARQTEDEDHIEILEAFPTRDHSLMQRYRKGAREKGGDGWSPSSSSSSSQMVH